MTLPKKPRTRREDRAYHEGRMAFRMGIGNCPLRSLSQRAVWREGYDHERRLALAEKITPAQRAEAVAVAGRLKAWVRQQKEATA